ncbi:hypothetical protein MAR_005540, partial [Mya arenaria]
MAELKSANKNIMGYCGKQCRQFSYVCNGNFKQVKNYMPENVKVKMTQTDEQVLTKCLEMGVLGGDNLENTKLMTTTQKCEAVNRSYQAVHPKSVTFLRNCSGRIHGQILKLNNGYAGYKFTHCWSINLQDTDGLIMGKIVGLLIASLVALQSFSDGYKWGYGYGGMISRRYM